MSREIKFRAWMRKQWMADDVFPVGDTLAEMDGDTPVMVCLLRDVHLMQYTGLKDKNGVEIYEGDVMRVGNSKAQLQVMELLGVVELTFFTWQVGQIKTIKWERYNAPKPTKRDSISFGSMVGGKVYEVIGNIHENKELLNG